MINLNVQVFLTEAGMFEFASFYAVCFNFD